MPNKWLAHVKKTMKNMKAKGTYEKGKGLKQVIMAAKKTWHKAKKGGGDDGLEDVSLGDSGKADSSTKQMGTTVTDSKGEEASVLGGRRKTRRRRRHSRRR
jgi:hypothetical protein